MIHRLRLKAEHAKRALRMALCHYGDHARLTCELLSCLFIAVETRIVLFAAVAVMWLFLDLMILIDKLEEAHYRHAHKAVEHTRVIGAGQSFTQFPGEVE